MNLRVFSIILAFIWFGNLVGCTPSYVKKRYYGNALPGSEITGSHLAIISFGDFKTVYQNLDVIPCKIDNHEIEIAPGDPSITLFPGEHTIVFCKTGNPASSIEWNFSAKAGYFYEFRCDWENEYLKYVVKLEELTEVGARERLISSTFGKDFSCTK